MGYPLRKTIFFEKWEPNFKIRFQNEHGGQLSYISPL